MRLIDDRYTDERSRLEIALRMIRHDARTATIRECTGISEDRIRKLYRSYCGSAQIQRKRGKSPQQIQSLMRNLEMRTDSGLLAALLVSIGVLDAVRRNDCNKIDCESGAKLCTAYELFLRLRPSRCELSFEHAYFLTRALVADDELTLALCPRCGGTVLEDRLAPPRLLCPLCETKRLTERKLAPRRRRTRLGENRPHPSPNDRESL
jgi:hypothetical protein